jgi:hypothetical protein
MKPIRRKKIVCWFAMRWQLEVTFQEVRAGTWASRPKGSGRRYGDT